VQMAFQTVAPLENCQWRGKVNEGRMYYLDANGSIWPDLTSGNGWRFSTVDADSPLLYIHNGKVTQEEFSQFKKDCWEFLMEYGKKMRKKQNTFPNFEITPGRDNFVIAALHPWKGIPGLKGQQISA
jgi:hypothetical protein